MSKPVKILIHGLSGNPGGTESCMMNYYRNISPNRIQFDFLGVNAGHEPAYGGEITGRGGKIYLIPGRRRYFDYRRELDSIFKNNKYDGLWSNVCTLSGTIPLFRTARRFGVPLRILHAHNSDNMSPFVNNRIFHEIDKYRITGYVTDFWTCSEKASGFFYSKKIINLPEYRVINNAINTVEFRFDAIIRNDLRKTLRLDNNLVIGHVGHFHFQKNHAFLIRVFHEIYKKRPNAVLLLVGDGELRAETELMAKKLNLAGAVRFLGIRYDVPALLNAMDIFLLPSRFEGLPFTLIEAQAASLPCFTSTTVSAETAVTDLLSFVDLKKTPEEWAEYILAQRERERVDMTDRIRKAGYDIKSEAAKVEQYLLGRVAEAGA